MFLYQFVLQNVLMMSLNTTFLLHMPMKGRGMNFSEKYFSPWLFVSSIFQRVMGSGRLGGRGGVGGRLETAQDSTWSNRKRLYTIKYDNIVFWILVI